MRATGFWASGRAQGALLRAWRASGRVRRAPTAGGGVIRCLSHRSVPQPWAMRHRHQPGHAALRRHRRSCPGQVYHVTSATVGREPVFRGPVAFAVARSFGSPALWGDAKALAWVLMPDHAHWLLQLGPRDDLGVVVNRIKSASARLARLAARRPLQVWSRGYYERAIRDESGVHGVARYIVENPVLA